jgi:hypothetical protein
MRAVVISSYYTASDEITFSAGSAGQQQKQTHHNAENHEPSRHTDYL